MAKIERTYNIPLRKEWLKAPMYRRSKKATTAVREFLAKNMKVELSEVKIGKHLNEEVWSRGIRHPPHHVKVNVVKDDSGMVFAELVGHKIEEMLTKETKGKKEEKAKAEKPEAPKEKKAEAKPAEKKVEPKKEAPKPAVKAEIKK
jgi:ribosomal protein L31E